LVVERLEVPVTFRELLPKIEAALRVVTLVVDRLEVPEVFTLVVNMLGAAKAFEAYTFPKT